MHNQPTILKLPITLTKVSSVQNAKTKLASSQSLNIYLMNLKTMIRERTYQSISKHRRTLRQKV